MLGRSEAVIQISQSYRGILIEVNAYQALVWSSTLLSFQKHCFNLTKAALPFVTLAGDCIVKHRQQRSGNLLQEQHKLPTNVKPVNIPQQSQAEAAPQVCLTQVLRPSCLAEGRGESVPPALTLQEPAAVAGREQHTGCRLSDAQPQTTRKKLEIPPTLPHTVQFPLPQSPNTSRSSPTRYRGGSGQGWSLVPVSRRKAVMLCPSWKHTLQSCQLKGLPKQLKFAEAWRNPWDYWYYKFQFTWQRKYTGLYSSFFETSLAEKLH